MRIKSRRITVHLLEMGRYNGNCHNGILQTETKVLYYKELTLPILSGYCCNDYKTSSAVCSLLVATRALEREVTERFRASLHYNDTHSLVGGKRNVTAAPSQLQQYAKSQALYRRFRCNVTILCGTVLRLSCHHCNGIGTPIAQKERIGTPE